MSTKDKFTDPRFQRSLESLIESVTELVDQQSIHKIPITRIVERAGVTRPTFYQHFADVPSAAQRAALVRLAAAFPVPEPISDCADLSTQEMVRRVERHALPVLEHLQSHRSFYMRILEEGANAAFFEELIAFVSARLLPEVFEGAVQRRAVAREDILTVVAGGMTWLAIHWLRVEAHSENPRAMARRLARVATTIIATDA